MNIEERLARFYNAMHGTALLFGGAALYFAIHTMSWLSEQETLTSDNLMLVLGLLIGSVVGGFAGIAVSRTTPEPPPQVPAALASELIQMASSKASASDIADELERKL